ncbi:MAG: hypothetical protein A4E65_02295 [Syntrophorhabdus sp. PtaU1.Bin153]|nr:MAG: hypothetical protein A4E65_02295 [Syntrophorhabdus sp. PtaU1.Bin153]
MIKKLVIENGSDRFELPIEEARYLRDTLNAVFTAYWGQRNIVSGYFQASAEDETITVKRR